MGTVRITDGRFEIDGRPFYPVGVNYIPRYVCTNFWEDWREDVIKEDIRTLAEAGFNCVRVPVHWASAEPQPGRYSRVVDERFNWLIKAFGDAGLYVMPFFLVGVCTGFYDVPYRNGESFLRGRMLELAEGHLRHFTGMHKGDPHILGWDICDEPEFYNQGAGAEQLPYDPRVIKNYVRTLADAIRQADDTHLVTLGFCHICSEQWGIHVRDMAEILDAMSVTGYAYYVKEPIDALRNGYFIAWMTRFQHLAGKEVFLGEAPGFTSASNAEDVLANYVKVSAYSSLAAGSLGAVPWVYSDYEQSLHSSWPLDTQPNEPFFGFWRADGSRKPSCDVLAGLAKSLRELPITDYRLPERGDMAILVPEAYYERMPQNFHAAFMAYVLGRMAGLRVDYVWERDLDQCINAYACIVNPFRSGLTVGTWQRLCSWVEAGGTLYSVDCYFPGFPELFGLSIRGNLPGPACERGTMREEWHLLRAGEVLELPSQPEAYPLWRAEPGTRVLASYGDGRPLLTLNRRGKGKAVACAHTFESSFMDGSAYRRWRAYPGWKIYRCLAREAGVTPVAESGDPCVETMLMPARSGRGALLMLLNHDEDAVSTDVRLPHTAESAHPRPGSDGRCRPGDGGSLQVDLPPYGVMWLQIE